jgi:chromosome segregation ATPase
MSQPAEGSVVQELLADNRRLRVENQRLQDEIDDLRRRSGGPDPRIAELEAESRRLRLELAAAAEARESLEDAVAAVLGRIERA